MDRSWLSIYLTQLRHHQENENFQPNIQVFDDALIANIIKQLTCMNPCVTFHQIP